MAHAWVLDFFNQSVSGFRSALDHLLAMITTVALTMNVRHAAGTGCLELSAFLTCQQFTLIHAKIMHACSTVEKSWRIFNGTTKWSFENSELVDTPAKCAFNVDAQLGAVEVVGVKVFFQILPLNGVMRWSVLMKAQSPT